MLTAVFGTLLALLVLVRVIGSVARWRADLTSPGGIARRVTGTGRRHVVRFGANRYSWNPAFPVGRENRVPGPGTATYTLDDNGVVQLDFAPTHGEARHYSGPLPEGLSQPEHAPSVLTVLLAPAVAVIGFVIGYFVLTDPGDHRFASGALIAIVGWVVVSVALMVTHQLIRTQAMTAARAK